MKNRGFVLTMAAALIAALACGDDTTAPVSKIVTFKATMNGATEVPSNTTTGSGVFDATLDTSTNVFTYTFSFTGLSSNTTLGHIHGPAATGANAGTTINFATLPNATFTLGATSGTGGGTATLNSTFQVTAGINGDSLRKLILINMTYVNIHTTTNGGGEIRGQLIKQP